MKEKQKVLVIAAHPDDEILGCGATIAKHVMHGDTVHVLILSRGVTSRGNNKHEHTEELKLLDKAAHAASQLLGVESLELSDFPDNRMDSVDRLDIIKVIENKIEKFQPGIVYTHFSGDVNVDHSRVSDAVITACRPVPGQSVECLLFFEVPSSTEWQVSWHKHPFIPNWHNNIEATLEKKLQALEIYSMEMRPWPHARSIKAVEHLARWRGATVGCEAAEAFMLGRYRC